MANDTAANQPQQPPANLAAVIDKIKKLQALRDDAAGRGSVHEAEAAAARVDELLQRYRLDAASIPAGSDDAPPPEAIGEEHILQKESKAVTWRGCLAYGVAQHYGCSMFNRRRYERVSSGKVETRWYIALVGRPSDVALVKHMLAWLVLEIGSLSQRYGRGGVRGPLGVVRGASRADLNAFRHGCVDGFLKALRESRERATAQHRREAGAQAANTAALALRDQKAELSRYLERLNLRASRVSVGGDGAAYGAGQAAGARIRTHAALPGGRRMLGSGK